MAAFPYFSGESFGGKRKFAKQTLRQAPLALAPTPADGHSPRLKGLRHSGENGISTYVMGEVCLPSNSLVEPHGRAPLLDVMRKGNFSLPLVVKKDVKSVE